VRKTGDHFYFNEVAKQTNPAERDRIINSMTSGGDQFRFELKFRPPDPGRYSVAMLHSAYLAAFRNFGFEYLLYGDTQWIRDILESDDLPAEVHYLSMEPKRELRVPPEMMFTPGVKKTEGRFVMVIPLPLPSELKIPRLVFLPGFGREAAEDYTRLLRNWAGRDHHLRLGWDVIDPATRLGDPARATFGRSWWRHWVQKLNAKSDDLPAAEPSA
jgi:hypothetical protein